MASLSTAFILLFAFGASGRPEPEPARRLEPASLEFRELLEPGPKAEPSEKVRGLKGKRVRIIGFMAHMEDSPRGAFYLVPRPLHCAEDGAGTGDLPPAAIRVVVRSSAGEEIPFYPGTVSVTGILDLGHQADDEGRASFFRILLDRPADLSRPAESAPKASE